MCAHDRSLFWKLLALIRTRVLESRANYQGMNNLYGGVDNRENWEIIYTNGNSGRVDIGR